MELREVFVDTSFGKLHALASGPSGSSLPTLFFIPGMLGRAEDWLNDFESLAPYPCVALSLRGRGQSSHPRSGFKITDHAADIAAVVDHLKLKEIILVGFSQGALYATSYAAQNPDKVKALIIQDKNLNQKKFGQTWVEKAKNHPACKDREDFLWAIANDSQDINLLEHCQSLAEKPVLIIKGEDSPMLMEDELLEMKNIFKKAKVKVFTESGHDVAASDYPRYVNTMKSYIESLV